MAGGARAAAERLRKVVQIVRAETIEQCAQIADKEEKQAEHDTDRWTGSISLAKGEVGRCKSIAKAIRDLKAGAAAAPKKEGQ